MRQTVEGWTPSVAAHLMAASCLRAAKTNCTAAGGLVLALCLLLVATASAQEVQSIFMPGQNAEGYYVANSGAGMLHVSLLAELSDVRPIAFRARVIVDKNYYGEQKVTFDRG